jgi:2'-5' RNA ligase
MLLLIVGRRGDRQPADPVPAEWLHLTMQGVGFTADVPPPELARVVAAVRGRLAELAPVTLTFTRPVLLPEAVALPPEPAEPVHAIRGAIRVGIADAWGLDNVPEADGGYRAHLSIGYVNRPGPAAPIIAVLDSVHPEPASTTVTAASLIELHRDSRVYQWRTIEDVPLGP